MPTASRKSPAGDLYVALSWNTAIPWLDGFRSEDIGPITAATPRPSHNDVSEPALPRALQRTNQKWSCALSDLVCYVESSMTELDRPWPEPTVALGLLKRASLLVKNLCDQCDTLKNEHRIRTEHHRQTQQNKVTAEPFLGITTYDKILAGLTSERENDPNESLLIRASLAHELSSPLTSMTCEVDAAIRWLNRSKPEIAKALEGLAELSKVTAHLQGVCRALFRVHDSGTNDFSYFLLGRLVGDVVASIPDPNELGVSVVVNMPYPVLAYGNQAQVRLIVRNLLSNGIKAVLSQPIDQRFITISIFEVPGFTFMTVEDSGAGLSANRSAESCNVFPTSSQAGMGLGLVICEHILLRHEGRMWNMQSRNGANVFLIRLPDSITQ